MDVLTWEGIHVIIPTPGEYREFYQQESKYFQKCGSFFGGRVMTCNKSPQSRDVVVMWSATQPIHSSRQICYV